MNNQHIDGLKQGHRIQEFPIKDQQRMCTDIFCMIIGIGFTLAIVIASIIVFNGDHYMRTSFPSDSQGRVCGYDLTNHPYIYFTNFPSIKQRVCVQACPNKGDNRLNCVPTDSIGCVFSNTPNFTVTFYQSIAQSLQIGSFCVPTQSSLKQKLYEDIDVTNRYHFFTQIKCVVICGLVALGLSILYLCLVEWMPKLMNYLSVILGLVFAAIMGLFMIFYPTQNTLYRILLGVIVLVLMGVVGYGAFKSSACFDMHGVFLSYAAQLLKQDIKLLIYIPMFLAIFTLFIIITLWQLKSLWSSSPINFTEQHVYYQLQPGSTTFLTVLVMFQFIWGLSFIKQSFNFCISGNAILWYDKQLQTQPNGWIVFRPLKYLARYHFGSVVAGSFINIVFSLFDYIFDVVRSDGNTNPNSCVSMLDSLFDLVRSDSMSYINLSGNPYCNASRYCQKLCRKSPIAEYSQSISRSYRICSHFLLAAIVSTISFFLQEEKVSIFIVLVVFILSIFISTFFISLHADAAQAIQIIFLLDYQFAKEKEKDSTKHHLGKLVLRNNKIREEYYKESQKIKEKTVRT